MRPDCALLDKKRRASSLEFNKEEESSPSSLKFLQNPSAVLHRTIARCLETPALRQRFSMQESDSGDSHHTRTLGFCKTLQETVSHILYVDPAKPGGLRTPPFL
jgi:hypothetical protein